MESEEIDPEWFGYECKSGQILFYYNQTTGEHRWASNKYADGTTIRGEAIQSNKVLSKDTQTDDYGCINGCTSKYIENDSKIPRGTATESCITMESEPTDPDWIGYACKSGQILFYFNKTTGEHRWPCDIYDKSTNTSDEPLQSTEIQSEGTQTDDYGCTNGCTSMYIDQTNNPKQQSDCNTRGNVEIQPTPTFRNALHVDVCVNENVKHGIEEETNLDMLEATTSNENNEVCSVNGMDDIDPKVACHGKASEGQVEGKKANDSNTSLTSDVRMTEDRKINNIESTNDIIDNQFQESEGISELSNQSKESELSFKELDEHSSDLQVDASCNTQELTFDPQPDDTVVQHNSDNSTIEKETLACGDQGVQELDKGFDCKLCDIYFPTSNEYYNHLVTHCSESSCECPVCEKVFRKKSYLFSHLRNHLQKQRYKAKHYNKVLNRNTQEHNRVKANVCKHCNKSFTYACTLKTHERIHTGVKPYKCKHCNKAFTQQGSLQTHERIHTGVKPYKCKHCNKAFTEQGNLKKHERIHTGVKPYKCKHCNKAFTVKCSLENHERIHTGVKPYTCKHCNKAFTQQDNLKKHERIHTGVKPYKCKHCNKAFTQQGSLETHERIHTGVKPYKCKHCNKAFTEQGNLKKHERIHTGVKPYKCKHCNTAFTRQGHLETNERIHTGVKPYKCKHCNKAFAQQGDRINTDIKPQKCNHYPKFTLQTNARKYK